MEYKYFTEFLYALNSLNTEYFVIVIVMIILMIHSLTELNEAQLKDLALIKLTFRNILRTPR